MAINTINSVYYFRLSSKKQANAAMAMRHYIDNDFKSDFRYQTNLLVQEKISKNNNEI